MNDEPTVKEILQEIENLNPSIITISGNTDRTYSSCEFYEVLMINQDNKYEHGIKTKFSKTESTISKWIMKIIKDRDPEYNIIKFYDVYVVGTYTYKDPPYYDNCGISVDFGGIIKVYKTN